MKYAILTIVSYVGLMSGIAFVTDNFFDEPVREQKQEKKEKTFGQIQKLPASSQDEIKPELTKTVKTQAVAIPKSKPKSETTDWEEFYAEQRKEAEQETKKLAEARAKKIQQYKDSHPDEIGCLFDSYGNAYSCAKKYVRPKISSIEKTCNKSAYQRCIDDGTRNALIKLGAASSGSAGRTAARAVEDRCARQYNCD